MTSLLCVKNLDGNVTVHDQEVALSLSKTDHIIADNLRTKYMKKQKKKKHRRPKTTPAVNCHHGPIMDAGSLVKNATKMQEFGSPRPAKDLQEKSMTEYVLMQRIYVPLLDEETKFVKEDLGKIISHVDLMELRKRELLHKKWTDRVYEPIRRKILEAMNSQERSELYRRRQAVYHQFIEHVNRKGHVFLDTIDKAEYNAVALNCDRNAPLAIYTPALEDPLLLQERERDKEDQTILRCATGQVYSHKDIHQLRLPTLPMVPQGRHGTDSTTWLEMPLVNIESTPRKASRESKRKCYGNAEVGVLRMKPERSKTQIDFAEWSSRAYDPRIGHEELGLQHKRMFEEKPPYGIPARIFAKAPFASETTSGQLGSGLNA